MNYEALDRKVAYLGVPIRSVRELNAPLVTNAPNPEWDERLQEQWWYSEETIQKELSQNDWMNKRLLELHKKLLSFGGVRTCLPTYEMDLDAILKRGQLWRGNDAEMMPGAPSQCHRNSVYCWDANRTRAILCTGYALSSDGLWRQHSWLVNIRTRKIVETTVSRVAYFGFALTTEEAEEFLADY